MNYEKYSEAITACRFCFMCRHLSAVANVTFTEADTPRIRTSMIYGLKHNPESIKCADFINTIYRSDLSACCRFHCVNHYDENGLNIAMRQDIAEANLAPEYVVKVAEEFKAKGTPELSGSADVLYYIDEMSASVPSIAEAFAKIAKSANVSYMTAQGGCCGKALKVLGYLPEAKAKAQAFAAVLNATPAKTIVVSNPAAYDAFVNDFAEYGVSLNAKVVHTSEFIAGLKLSANTKGQKLYYLESDFLKNYVGDYNYPQELLSAMGAELAPFGTNNEESYTCGEGALVMDKMWPEIVAKMAKYIEERADNLEADLFVCSSPYTRKMLSTKSAMQILTIEEYVAKNI